jgi:hypothetical protein
MRSPIEAINCHPIRYPKHPPSTDPTEHINAYFKDFLGIATASAISSISGGIGKKEDSLKASRNNAHVPYGVSAQLSTQS